MFTKFIFCVTIITTLLGMGCLATPLLYSKEINSKETGMKEIWKDVLGYKGYQVSNIGRVKRLPHWIDVGLNNVKRAFRKEKILKQSCDTPGYYQVWLYLNKKRKGFRVHKLVAQAFIPNPQNKPQVNHIDGNKLNNKVDNLEWCTNAENQIHVYKIGLQKIKVGEQSPNAKLEKQEVIFIKKALKLRKYSSRKLAKMFNVCKSTILSIKHKETWNHIVI